MTEHDAVVGIANIIARLWYMNTLEDEGEIYVLVKKITREWLRMTDDSVDRMRLEWACVNTLCEQYLGEKE